MCILYRYGNDSISPVVQQREKVIMKRVNKTISDTSMKILLSRGYVKTLKENIECLQESLTYVNPKELNRVFEKWVANNADNIPTSEQYKKLSKNQIDVMHCSDLFKILSVYFNYERMRLFS